ncbi:hypothetical protein PAUR_a3444 [Pseudoalteromonas aurantia 208]|uniref:Orphan protein n=1 Tax=Pseudoalteromonas aurantia 208 TaxID=1314867 RepID=A0ABR9E620_9GAMM|nr:hypothetical protein [Pseudoalteromonas aurantia 208]
MAGSVGAECGLFDPPITLLSVSFDSMFMVLAFDSFSEILSLECHELCSMSCGARDSSAML